MPPELRNITVLCGCWTAMLFVLLLGDGMTHLEFFDRFDKKILESLAISRTAALDRVFANISWAGSSILLLPLTFTIAVIISFRNYVQEALFLITSFIGGSLLNNIAKHVIARPRPDGFQAVIDAVYNYSFPSSHAFQVTAFVMSLLVIMKPLIKGSWYRGAQTCGGSVIFVVCLSRIYLQVHYPSDVAAGFLAALFWVLGMAALMLAEDRNRGDSFVSPKGTAL